ncbi:hypothetical protein TNCT_186691 [Trichonephila clavata]|uniref:Uncharacterized protein n=1 Tax=Trichonephila clavata TaxID=2740835 RepID=A0A8X6H2A0_TRICU|nr:hypothetical protein TNCT_186691 [Trichonephila clavata]
MPHDSLTLFHRPFTVGISKHFEHFHLIFIQFYTIDFITVLQKQVHFLLDEGAVDTSAWCVNLPEQLPAGDFCVRSSATPNSIANYKISFRELLG